MTEITKEKKTVHPPHLFNLTALQKEAHKKYGYTPEQTLNAAQALYETHQCLSYPRTPSSVMGDGDVPLVKKIYETLIQKYEGTRWECLCKDTDPALIVPSNKRVFNSAALHDHHALIPLAVLPDDAPKEAADIYRLVAERFFTAFKSDYVYNAVKIFAGIGGGRFEGRGVEVLQQGWKTAPDEDEEKEDDLSGVEEKEYPLVSIQAKEKFTEPKKHYTFASLLALMENPRGGDGSHLAGIGTPATRGAILEKLTTREYIAQEKTKTIRITQTAAFLIENIKKNSTLASFFSIEETTRWEEKLHENTADFLDGVKDFVRRTVADTALEKFAAEKKSLGKCPLCGGDIYEGKKSCYCSNYKSGCSFAVWKEIAGAAVTAQDVELLLADKPTKLKKCKSKAGKEFSASFTLNNGKIEFNFADKKK